jgi:hypothetical protein
MADIDRLKRVAILLGTIVALSASAVPAQDRLTKDDLATLAATLGVYDSRCETLPPGLRADLQRMIRLLDKDDLMARGLNEQEKIDRVGAVVLRAVDHDSVLAGHPPYSSFQ